MFISKFHILALLPSQTQIQNLSNSLDHIYHLVSPFSLLTLFFDGFPLYNNWVCQKIVTRSAGSSAVAGGFGAGDIGNFSVVAAVCLVFECTGCFAGVLSILTLQITIPVLFYIFTNGAICLLWCHSGMGDWCFMRAVL